VERNLETRYSNARNKGGRQLRTLESRSRRALRHGKKSISRSQMQALGKLAHNGRENGVVEAGDAKGSREKRADKSGVS